MLAAFARAPIDHLVLAVSGGGDSMALLHAAALARDRAPQSPSLRAVTVDHGLRPEAADEAAFVARAAAALRIPHEVVRPDWSRPTAGIQAEARAVRLGALRRVLLREADDPDRAAILTAHTADDDAETIAMRRERTPDRARGIAEWAWLQPGWMYRPWLRLHGTDLRAWLRERGASWVEDPSNADPAFERTRVRIALAGNTQVKARLLSRARDGERRYAKAASSAGRLICLGTPLAPFGRSVRLYRRDLQADRDAIALALRVLIGFVGGLNRLPSARKVAAIVADASENEVRRSIGRCTVSRDRRGDWIVEAEQRKGAAGASRRAASRSWGEAIHDGRLLTRPRPGFHCATASLGRHAGEIEGHQSVSDPLLGRRLLNPWVELVPAPDWPLAVALAETMLGRALPKPPVGTFRPAGTCD